MLCCCVLLIFSIVFFKQKTAYEMRISDWSSDVLFRSTITMARRNWRKRLEAEARPSPHAPSPRHCMTPQEFLNKWRHVELKERSASQSHFNDLCALLGVLDPIAADPKGEWFA